jgi:hypothetical protein
VPLTEHDRTLREPRRPDTLVFTRSFVRREPFAPTMAPTVVATSPTKSWSARLLLALSRSNTAMRSGCTSSKR